MKDRFDLMPKTFHDTPLDGYCVICVAPCGESGWVRIEGPNIVVCRCCIELLVTAAPDIARDTLQNTKTQGEST